MNAGDNAAKKKFQEIAAAYEVLKDPKRRKHFDQTGDTGGPPEAGAPRPPGERAVRRRQPVRRIGARASPGAGPSNFRWSGDFGDLFSDLFSGPVPAPGGGARGFEDEDDDAAAELTIPFRDAVLGGTITLQVRAPKRCARCGGSGRVGHAACPICHGAGEVVSKERLSVRIPAGVATGSKGARARQGPHASRATSTSPSPSCRTRTSRARATTSSRRCPSPCPRPISAPRSTCRRSTGRCGRASRPGPPGGQRFRLKGYGVRSGRAADGDHYYRVTIAMPARVTDEGRAVAEKFAALYESDPRASLPRRSKRRKREGAGP